MAFRWLLEAGIQPKSLVHDLQNHDELTYQLPELKHRRDEPFTINGKTMSGGQLHEKILQEMREKAVGEGVFWWNHLYRSKQDGVATTMVGFIAAALHIKDPYNATAEEKEKIKKAHLLVAMANAMQPGVFSLSAWDLVGALPLTQIPKRAARALWRKRPPLVQPRRRGSAGSESQRYKVGLGPAMCEDPLRTAEQAVG